MRFTAPDLPYSRDALEPHVSGQTLDLHYGKHHKGYFDKLNQMIAESSYEDMELIDVIAESRRASDTAVFNNAAQAWNHAFLWRSMSPDGGGDPEHDFKSALTRDFGDMNEFRNQFREAATGHFGSGWVWLVDDGGTLRILGTSDADTPIATRKHPLITLDVWEHAYYLDYQNERDRYVDAFLRHLINWDFAASRFEALQKAA